MRMNWVVNNAERFLRRSNQKHSYIFLHILIGPFLCRRQIQRRNFKGFGYLSDVWQAKINSSKPAWAPDVWVLQSTNGPASHHSPSLPDCRDRTSSFLAWTSFPKAFYYFLIIIIWCALHSSGKSQSSEVWEHQSTLCPSCPCSLLKEWRCHLHHLSHSYSPKLFPYLIVLTISGD